MWLVAVGLLGLLLAVLLPVVRQNDETSVLFSEWLRVQSADIRSLHIVPLPSRHRGYMTIDRQVTVTDRAAVVGIIGELRGENERGDFLPRHVHWSRVRQFCLIIKTHGAVYTFACSVHHDYPVTSYALATQNGSPLEKTIYRGSLASAVLTRWVKDELEAGGVSWVPAKSNA